MSKTVCENEATVTRFFCPICSDSVGRESDLERHMRVHTGEGLVYCTWPRCTHEDGFTQKCNLEQHVRSVHLGIRLSCPHLWVDASGALYGCDHTYSDLSNLIRHRSLDHGFEAGDDEANIQVPTLIGTIYPGSTYAHLRKNLFRQAPKLRPLPMPTPPTPTPMPTAEQEESDCDSLYTVEDAEPFEAVGPAFVQVLAPTSDLGCGVGFTPGTGPLPTQPPILFAGANLACPLMAPLDAPVVVPHAFPSVSPEPPVVHTDVTLATAPIDPEPRPRCRWQTATVNQWTFSSPITALHFTFPVAEQANLAVANAGLGLGWDSAAGWSPRRVPLSDDQEWMVQEIFMAIAPREVLEGYYGSVPT